MRLIDADHFLAFVKAELEQDRPDNMHIHNIIRVLEDLPAAYDPDRVVEQLKNLQDKAVNVRCADVSIYATGMMGKALNIVKAGGIDDSQT